MNVIPDDSATMEGLKSLLRQMPAIGNIHPLLPICLPPDVRIENEPLTLLDQLDDRRQTIAQPVLLTRSNRKIDPRFRRVRFQEHPPVDEINQNLGRRLDYIRKNLITSNGIAKIIERDVANHQYDIVVLLLVDGLGYGDVLDWEYDVVPCFIDGPSVTFVTDDAGNLNTCVGFASIIGNPGIAQRLYTLGYHSAFGYTYWQVRENMIAKYMFRGIPDNAVENFEDILDSVAGENIPRCSYIQIVRQGLDGLAHSRRELRPREVVSGIKAIKDDIELLANLLASKTQRYVIFVTADHGILWKNDHDWCVVSQSASRPRYSKQRPDAVLFEHTTRFESCNTPFYLYEYPYLGAPIRKNDSGVHGGLSYQESFVPLIKIEVQ